MREAIFTVERTRLLARNTFETVLSGDTSAITNPGQFVDLKLDGFFLRRPISVCDVNGNELTLVYKVVGDGTKALSEMPEGAPLSLLTGLGNGFDLRASGETPLLIGGGAGVPPMLWAAKCLRQNGVKPVAILGFNAADEVFYAEAFEALGVKTIVCTADGSRGLKGFVTEGMRAAGDYTYTYACGPLPMLRAVYEASSTDGDYSFEERMGCGFGACMGCTHQTKNGAKRLCKEGPVLKKGEIVW